MLEEKNQEEDKEGKPQRCTNFLKNFQKNIFGTLVFPVLQKTESILFFTSNYQSNQTSD